MSTDKSSKDLYSIREWAPLTDVFEHIPAYTQRGLFSSNLNVTCIDADKDFLALGSDVGIVFWYNRQTGVMQKLKAELRSRITCLKIVNSVEYMIAAGSSSGQVSIFQIQKEVPPDLNLVAPCTRTRPIERYTIRGLHRSVVSCCEWSKNGMKLYTGDRQGIVVLTELDYQTHICKSAEILAEAYEIVQLNIHQKYLLVSTLYRCIVCEHDAKTAKWLVTQIGKKDRKQLIDCGAIFLKQKQQLGNTNNKPCRLICGRPGFRFWLADVNGNVEKTLLFKEAVLRSPTWEIPILNPKSEHNRLVQSNLLDLSSSSNGSVALTATNNFRNIYTYAGQDALIVTHDDRTLYILNIERLRVEAVACGIRKIIDFCVCDNEIFVLEGERSLLRLAPLPEKPNKTAKVIFNPLLPPPVPVLGASFCKSFESPVEYKPEEQAIINAEECFELPPIESIDLNVPIELAVESPIAEQNRRLELFQHIGELDFEQSILHTSGLKVRKKSKTKLSGIVEIGHEYKEANMPAELNNKAVNVTEQISIQMDDSFCRLENNSSASGTAFDINVAYSQYLPDALSPITLQKTIAQKAKTLAVELELPEVHLAPLTDEELPASQAGAAPPPTIMPNGLQDLATCYPLTVPNNNEIKTAACGQTTPLTKLSYMCIGQPTDDICLNELTNNTCKDAPSHSKLPLQFVQAELKTTEEDINSFLPDFSRACDPLIKNETQCSDSNNLNEWEFLDN